MIAKLLEVQRDLLEKLVAVAQELETITSGGVSIGTLMRKATATWELLWCARYAPGNAIGYFWVGARDFPLLKRLVLKLGVEELEKRMGAYVVNDDPFFVKTRHQFASFVATVNSHTAIAAPADLELSAAPVGCQHQPACSSDQAHTRRRMAEMRA